MTFIDDMKAIKVKHTFDVLWDDRAVLEECNKKIRRLVGRWFHRQRHVNFLAWNTSSWSFITNNSDIVSVNEKKRKRTGIRAQELER